MKKIKELYKKTPGWLIMFAIFLVLYFTGWHKELASQVQGLVLKTGIMDADIPTSFSEDAPADKVGAGFAIKTVPAGDTLMFDQFHGKVVFLNFWATWCPPCKAEMPSIQALYEDVKSEDIEFVMLSLDRNPQEVVQGFMDENGYTFPVYGPLEQLPPEFQSRAIPTTYIISKQGKILFSHSGVANYDTKEMRGFLKELAAQ